ncbi:hypothetical protein TWF281_000103 [Arthrobotrys megalospora]
MSCPLLAVPLEIRNQVYRYLVIFNISPVPDPPKEENYWERFNTPSLNLSILRVNKQIHDEASSILYSENVFPIKIQIVGTEFCKTHESWSSQFSVSYETLWEDVRYFRALEDENVEYNSNKQHGHVPFTRITKDQIVHLPSSRYQYLLRRAKIAIYDLRVTAFDQIPDNLPRDAKNRKSVMSILMPFVRGRLSGILSDKRDARIDIEIHPAFLHPSSHELALARKLTEEDVDALDLKYLKDLAYTAWPLTLLSCEYDLKLAHPAERRFKDIKDEALEECHGDSQFSEKEEEGFRETNLGGSYSWAMEEGKLVIVGNWDTYPRSNIVYCSFPRSPPQGGEEEEEEEEE